MRVFLSRLSAYKPFRFSVFALSFASCYSAMAASVEEKPTDKVVVTTTTSALKVDTPAQETPESISVVTEANLVERAPKKLDEALRYTSGVMAQPYGADNDTDWLKIRGFDAATYLDGNRLFRDGYYTWLIEPYGLQRIEVLKGPASLLYGEAPPGGIVNAVQKKPTDSPQGEFKLEVGNNHYRTAAFDFSDYLNKDGSLNYRLVGMVNDADGELNGTDNRRYYLAPSIGIELSEQTRLTLLSTFLHDSGTPTNPFFPAAGTLIRSPHGKISPSTNLGEPDYDKYQRKQFSVGYLLEHELNDMWTLSQNANYGYNKLFLRSSYAFPNSDPNATELNRGIVFRDGHNTSFSLDNRAVAKWGSSRVDSTLLMGVNVERHETKGKELDNYAFGTVNPFNRDYGHFNPISSNDAADRKIEKNQSSLYAQYHGKLDEKWIGVVGGRYDFVKSKNKSRRNEQNESRDDHEFSFNTGLMYLAPYGLSPYVSYAESFDVLSTIDSATGNLYKPLKGKQTEVGVKYTPSDWNGYINLALFDIKQKNALVTNPKTFIATQTGEATSRGVELEGSGYVTDALKLTASYTYTEPKTDDTKDQGKKRAGMIPKHMASLWVDYDFNVLGVNGLKMGSGVRYIGKSKDSPASSQLSVPSATLWDAMASYEMNKQWQVQVNVNNILNKDFISACDYYCYYGQSRSVIASIKYLW